ncbi:MAG TPA: sugar ABC transporter substrate-binding protein [Thermomicrobiales bacterium]|jgi:multiple sugar transport system substrate-binding protein|nr:sugar ABC transporter substrate-binding protein [Thermomicrobiales bacterium]
MSRIITPALSRRSLIRTAAAGAAGATALAVAPRQAPAFHRRQEQTVRALMWNNSPGIDANFQKRVEAFQATNPDIRLNLEFLPWDQLWQKVQLAYASGDPYDTYFWDLQAYGHFKAGLLANLQPYLDAAGLFDPAQYGTTMMEAWKLDGQNYYAIPENFQTMALFYNKTLFDEAGMAVPDDTWTWQQTVEAAAALTKKDGDRVQQWGMAIGGLFAWWGLQTLSWAQGDAFVDQTVEPTRFQFSNPANIEAMRFAQNIITSGIGPSPAVAAQSADTSGFSSGRVALIPDGSWTISSYADLPFEWGMTAVPKWNDTRATMYTMGGWVVAEQSKVKDAAARWAIWCATEFQQTMAAEHDWIPVQNAARTSEAGLAGMPAGYGSMLDSLAEARFGDFYTDNTTQILAEVIGPNLERLYNGEQTPEETAAAMDEEGNELLAE